MEIAAVVKLRANETFAVLSFGAAIEATGVTLNATGAAVLKPNAENSLEDAATVVMLRREDTVEPDFLVEAEARPRDATREVDDAAEVDAKVRDGEAPENIAALATLELAIREVEAEVRLTERDADAVRREVLFLFMMNDKSLKYDGRGDGEDCIRRWNKYEISIQIMD